MATYSSVLPWRIPGTGQPGGLPSMGSHRVGHDWSDSAAAAAVYILNPLPIHLTPPYLQRRQWHPTPVLLPGKSHGRRSLVGCSPWGRWVSDTTEWLHFHFSLSCIGEGNGNPLQCSCPETPRDGGAWWAAVYGVAQSRTLLNRLSSSSSSCFVLCRWKVTSLPPIHHVSNFPGRDHQARPKSVPQNDW